MPFPIVAILFVIAHITSAALGHPIDCKKNPSETVCEYTLNK